VQDLLSDAQLDLLRQQMDPLADAAVQAIYQQPGPVAKGQGHHATGHQMLAQVNALLAKLQRNDAEVPAELPQPVRALFQADAHVGTAAGGWDEARLRRGAHFFERHGLTIATLLHLMSLPQTYAAAAGVKVLAFTSRMEQQTLRRILETGQMVFQVMDAKQLLDHGSGRRTVQKVRLLHAAVRRLILDSGQWNPEWGQPVNQEDLLGTLMSFTVTIVEGLRILQLPYDESEAEDYYYRFLAVAQLLGLQMEHVPKTLAEARPVAYAIARRHFRASPEGQRLTAALREMMQHLIPGTVFDDVVPALMRKLLGEEVADMLAIPSPGPLHHVLREAGHFFRLGSLFLSERDLVHRMLDKLAMSMLSGVLLVARGEQAGYELPEHLMISWGVPSPHAVAKKG
jgi:uncharacterized protein (DUF2236 family)